VVADNERVELPAPLMVEGEKAAVTLDGSPDEVSVVASVQVAGALQRYGAGIGRLSANDGLRIGLNGEVGIRRKHGTDNHRQR